MTTLARWLLRAFADHWPGGLPGDGDTAGPLFLVDRQDSTVLDVDTTASPTTLTPQTPLNDFDLNVGNALGVALTDTTETPAGLGGDEYLSEPVLSVRLDAASERQHGHVADAEEFRELYTTAVEVVQTEITNGTLQSAPVDGFYIAEPGNQRPQLDGDKDFFRYQFDVEPRGYRQV